jgi:hypothetical protein
MGNQWCPTCRKVTLFWPGENDDLVCSQCSHPANIAEPLAYVPDRKFKPCYEKVIPSGYIAFKEVVSELGKSERKVRYDIAASGYAALALGVKRDGRVLFPEKVIELTAKTGLYIQVSVSDDGMVLSFKPSCAAQIMQVTPKTVINDIKAGVVSGWCSGGHYHADAQNVLNQASLHKPVDSTPLFRDALKLSKEIRHLMASSH